MSVVGLTVQTALESPAVLRLSRHERRILWAVQRVGGGGLLITSGARSGKSENMHAQRRAFDFGTGGDLRRLPLLHEVASRLIERGWRGGIGLGRPPADLHLHVDARGYPAYFMELSKTRPVRVRPLNLRALYSLRKVYRVPPASGEGFALIAASVAAIVGALFIARRRPTPGMKR